MAYPNVTQPNLAYGVNPQPHVQVVINNNLPAAPVVTEQPSEVTPGGLEAQQPRATRSFLGRMVERITQSRRYQKAAAYTYKAFKPIKEWVIDLAGAMKILGKETWKGVSYGALGGLGAGIVLTALCPPLYGPAFTAGVSAGVTAGGIIGGQIGLDKAVDYFNAARKARREEAELIQHQARTEEYNPFSEEVSVEQVV